MGSTLQPESPPVPPRDRELAREWMSMCLYISISLLAAIGTIIEVGNPESSPLLKLWGILVGLIIAHWFAFSLASIATETGESRREDMRHAMVGVLGGLSVGVVITLCSLLVPAHWETTTITIALTGYIAAAAGTVARSHNAGWLRTAVIVAVVLVLAVAIIVAKSLLD